MKKYVLPTLHCFYGLSVFIGISFIWVMNDKISSLSKQGLTNNEKTLQIGNDLLRDQVNDLEFQLTSRRTYEEGLADGLLRSKNIGYVDGYHAAIQQMQEEQSLQSKPLDKELTSSLTQ